MAVTKLSCAQLSSRATHRENLGSFNFTCPHSPRIALDHSTLLFYTHCGYLRSIESTLLHSPWIHWIIQLYSSTLTLDTLDHSTLLFHTDTGSTFSNSNQPCCVICSPPSNPKSGKTEAKLGRLRTPPWYRQMPKEKVTHMK